MCIRDSASLQIVLFSFLFLEDVLRLLKACVDFFSERRSFDIPYRRKFISQIAIGLGAIPFASLLYGMYQGRYNYKVLNYTLEYDDLPEQAFLMVGAIEEVVEKAKTL